MNRSKRPRSNRIPPDLLPVLQRWEQHIQDIQHPAYEMTPEEFTPVLLTYHQLRAAGVIFDPMLIALMTVLQAQVFATDDDSDHDDADLMLAA